MMNIRAKNPIITATIMDNWQTWIKTFLTKILVRF